MNRLNFRIARLERDHLGALAFASLTQPELNWLLLEASTAIARKFTCAGEAAPSWLLLDIAEYKTLELKPVSDERKAMFAVPQRDIYALEGLTEAEQLDLLEKASSEIRQHRGGSALPDMPTTH